VAIANGNAAAIRGELGGVGSLAATQVGTLVLAQRAVVHRVQAHLTIVGGVNRHRLSGLKCLLEESLKDPHATSSPDHAAMRESGCSGRRYGTFLSKQEHQQYA
jgi:hypothetical protein